MLDKRDFKFLFNTYFDAVRSFIFYRCGDTEVASDIAQDIFLKVWEKRGMLSKDNMKALLYKMANEMVISNYRKETIRNEFEKSIVFHTEPMLSPEDELLYAEFKSLYAKTLEQMPENQRVVFLMSRNDEMKYQEIAKCLNISVKAVEKRMSAALHSLRKQLDEKRYETGKYKD